MIDLVHHTDMNELAYTKQASDKLLANLKAAGTWEADHIEYAFTNTETAQGLHMIAAARLESKGIRHEVSVRTNRKGFSYAKIKVYASEVKSDAQILQDAILNKWGIGSECLPTEGGILITKVRDQHSAATVLKNFRRHNIQAAANAYNDFSFFLPTSDVLALMA
jgi:hypothetical protein